VQSEGERQPNQLDRGVFHAVKERYYRAEIKKAKKQILSKECNSQFHLIYENGKFWRKLSSRYLIQAKGAFFAGN
jgi:hypothetical protein